MQAFSGPGYACHRAGRSEADRSPKGAPDLASKTITVGSGVGLHARPAALIAAAAANYDDDITISMNETSVDAASSLLIMTLGAEAGAEVTVESVNEEAVELIASMIETDLHS